MQNSKRAETPLMKQYWEIKSVHMDKILLFRMGDFFEMFFDDAIKAAPLLGIALTSRNKKALDETPMCGMPHHSIAGPINKLLGAGLKVAICDQVEDPKQAKGIVKRAVTRVLTPGMVYDPDSLESTKAHYIACLDEESVSFVDSTTGEAFYFICQLEDSKRLLEALPVAEVVIGDQSLVESSNITTITLYQEVNLSNLQFNGETAVLESAKKQSSRRLLSYLISLSGQAIIQTLRPFELKSLAGRMHLSESTLKHLEIFVSYSGVNEGSLFSAIHRTATSQGSRMLRHWLQFPLLNQQEIFDRQEQVERWIRRSNQLKVVRETLASVGDIERRLGKVNSPQVNARDMLSLSHSIRQSARAMQLANQSTNDQCLQMVERIEKTLVEDPPLSTKQGHLIKRGVDAQLDEYIVLSTESQSLLAQLEERERQNTGISSLKVRYNNVFGYYVEVTHTHKDKVPEHYKRKQTLANAERYYTDELIELEKKVLAAQSKREQLEFEIFESLQKDVLNKASILLKLSQDIAELDLLTSFAWLAIERNFVRPHFVEQGLQLLASRHPVVERSGKFVPNDLSLPAGGCMLLTGPNMAGKSTLMRQVALIAIMAQVGCFVPAAQARLPIIDQVLTRIGASDQLSLGLSTFMVEMTELSTILQRATPRSLVIVDEVGRGTSTFDGMSLAQSILEYLVSEMHCLCFFATHYHELTCLSEHYSRIQNAHMRVLERAGKIEFTHTLSPGPALKSYGIQVAKLAGLPETITKRAQHLLKDKESQGGLSLGLQMSFIEEPSKAQTAHPLIKAIESYPLNTKTPLEAMEQISKWQKDISSADLT